MNGTNLHTTKESIMDVRQRNGGASQQQQQQQQQQRSGTESTTMMTTGRIPPSAHRNNINHHNKQTTGINSSGIAFGFGIVIAIFVITVGTMTGTVSVTFNNNNNSIQSSDPKQNVRGMIDSEQQSIDLLARQTKELETFRQQNLELEDEVKKMKKMILDQKKAAIVTNHGKVDTAASTTIEKLQDRVGRFMKSTQRLKEMIQLISKHHLIEKYGAGPHYVEIILSFDPLSNIADATKTDDTERLLIELAPITEMPATVHWFLEQINATIYNGASFHRNAHHVVQGGVIQNFETRPGEIHQINELIRTTGLDSIPFQE